MEVIWEVCGAMGPGEVKIRIFTRKRKQNFFLWKMVKKKKSNEEDKQELKRHIECASSLSSIQWWEEQSEGNQKKPFKKRWLIHKPVSHIQKRQRRRWPLWAWSWAKAWSRGSCSLCEEWVCKKLMSREQRAKAGLEAGGVLLSSGRTISFFSQGTVSCSSRSSWGAFLWLMVASPPGWRRRRCLACKCPKNMHTMIDCKSHLPFSDERQREKNVCPAARDRT